MLWKPEEVKAEQQRKAAGINPEALVGEVTIVDVDIEPEPGHVTPFCGARRDA